MPPRRPISGRRDRRPVHLGTRRPVKRAIRRGKGARPRPGTGFPCGQNMSLSRPAVPAQFGIFHADPGVSSRRARCLGRRLRRLSAARRRPGGAADPPEGVGRRRALARHRRGAAHRRLDPARRRRHRVDPRVLSGRLRARPALQGDRPRAAPLARQGAGPARDLARMPAPAHHRHRRGLRPRALPRPQRLSRRRPLSSSPITTRRMRCRRCSSPTGRTRWCSPPTASATMSATASAP